MNNLTQNRYPIRRIGLFGGTFNPIHRGHIKVAEDVLQQLKLDHIYVIPCALPPHKTQGPLASAKDRAEMARLALQGQSDITVSHIEIDRRGPSYTIDTLREFRAMHGETAALNFMVGVDAFLEIHTWKSYQQLFDLSTFILMTRPEPGNTPFSLDPLAIDYVRHHISDGYALASDGRALVHPEKKAIYLAPVTPIAIASTQIRDMVRHGESIRQWVSPAVAEYIDNKGLYR